MTHEYHVAPTPSATLIPSEGELAGLFRLCETLCQTNFVPDAFRNRPAETLAAVLYGRELGVGPMQALQQINVIKGKPSASPELMRALVRRRGHSISVIENGDENCVLEGVRADDGTVERSTFTMDDAHRANLANGGAWKTYPKAMLLARATSQLCRSLFADVISGISYTPEELQSIDEPTTSAGPAAKFEATFGLVSPADAKGQVIEACGGDIELARSLWGGRGSTPIAREDLAGIIELAAESTTEVLPVLASSSSEDT
jgi:hypothetical protein